jgi:hypothetical protein
MALFNADSDVEAWMKHNVRPGSSFFCFFFFRPPSSFLWLTRPLTRSFCSQRWAFPLPDGITCVGHVVLMSEAEFLGLLQENHAGPGRICYRAAVKLCGIGEASVTPPSGGPVASVTKSGNSNVHFAPHIQVVLPPSSSGQVDKNTSQAQREERPADPNKRQTSLPAIFGKPRSFSGLSDEKVLKCVGWSPIASGGHTTESKVSVFRNKFMADFVRQNPKLVFDKDLEKEARADSLLAYENQEKQKAAAENYARISDVQLPDLFELEGDKDTSVGKRVVNEEEKEGSPSKRQVLDLTGDPTLIVAESVAINPDQGAKVRAAQSKILEKMSSRRPKEAIQLAEEKEAEEKEAEEKDSGERKRAAAEQSSVSDGESMDLVQKVVNPKGISVSVLQLKVIPPYSHLCFNCLEGVVARTRFVLPR